MKTTDSVTSRCILYCLNGLGTQKIIVTLFPCIFQVKTSWNIVLEYLKTKIFLVNANILPQMKLIKYFGPITALGFLGFTKLSSDYL